MTTTNRKSGFTLVELLATIAIMAVLIVAALPYVADYTTWAKQVAHDRDAQVVASAMARWIAVGGDTSTWTLDVGGATVEQHNIANSLIAGTTVGTSGTPDPFLAPNTDVKKLITNIAITWTNSRNYTVAGR